MAIVLLRVVVLAGDYNPKLPHQARAELKCCSRYRSKRHFEFPVHLDPSLVAELDVDALLVIVDVDEDVAAVAAAVDFGELGVAEYSP